MQRNAGDAPLRRLGRAVLPVADYRVSDRRELHADLVLQSRHQRNPDEGGGRQGALYGIAKFGASPLGVPVRRQLLKHPLPPEVVNQRRIFGGDLPADYREILPLRRMGEKLSHECIAIRLGFREEQNTGRKAVDTMDDKRSLSPGSQGRREERPGGRSIRAFHRHGRKTGGLVQGHDGIVFVEHDQVPLFSAWTVLHCSVPRRIRRAAAGSSARGARPGCIASGSRPGTRRRSNRRSR